MDLSIVRLHSYNFLMARLSKWTRAGRMRLFEKCIPLKPHSYVLDLGGQPEIWDHINQSIRIRIVNLPGIAHNCYASRHSIEFAEGDACALEVEENMFDCVFCNSVIEHVGAFEKRKALADVIRRSAQNYWVQTPAIWFPIEPHCGLPFWWFYPNAFKQYFLTKWRKNLPDWTAMVEGTTVVSKRELIALFPDATIVTERFFGIPKSYIAYRVDIVERKNR